MDADVADFRLRNSELPSDVRRSLPLDYDYSEAAMDADVATSGGDPNDRIHADVATSGGDPNDRIRLSTRCHLVESVLQASDDLLPEPRITDASLHAPVPSKIHVDNQAKMVLQHMSELEEMIPQDFDLRLQSLEVQSKEVLSAIESIKQTIEGQRQACRNDVALVRRLFDTLCEQQDALRKDLLSAEIQQSEDRKQISVELANINASVQMELANMHADVTRPRSSTGVDHDSSFDLHEYLRTFDWHEYLRPEVQGAVASAEVHLKAWLKEVAEKTCDTIFAQFEQSIRTDLATMQLNLQVIEDRLSSSKAEHWTREEHAEEAELRQAIQDQLKLRNSRLNSGAELRQAIKEQLNFTKDIEAQPASTVDRTTVQETDRKGRVELERRVEAVEGATERWLQRSGGTVELAVQQLSEVKRQLISSPYAEASNNDSANCLTSLFHSLETECQALLHEIPLDGSLLPGTASAPTPAPVLFPGTDSAPTPAHLPIPGLLLPGSASAPTPVPPPAPSPLSPITSFSPTVTCTSGEVSERQATAPVTIQNHEIPSKATETLDTIDRGLFPVASTTTLASSVTRSEQPVFDVKMQALVDRLETLLERNVHLSEINQHMSEQLVVHSGNSTMTPDTSKTAMPRYNVESNAIDSEKNDFRFRSMPSENPYPQSTGGACQSPGRRIGYMPSSKFSSATTGNVNSPPMLYRSVSPGGTQVVQQQQRVSQLQSGAAQPLQQQAQWPNPAVRLLSPAQSARCISPPPVQRVAHSMNHPMGAQAPAQAQAQQQPMTPSRPAPGISASGSLHSSTSPATSYRQLGQALGPQSPISSRRECR